VLIFNGSILHIRIVAHATDYSTSTAYSYSVLKFMNDDNDFRAYTCVAYIHIYVCMNYARSGVTVAAL
jgi:hypothetical protein